ncbi:5'-nucleotidase C-terminal domain-containing protein [Natronoflexus pectinivorans]|uniref:5'-nucleotidase-like protein n=1 Tax=Natronoflexus pectinivorans TaxID=682526 RepID=A0A4R2GHA5_9BACT|nr:5'-nucleotidase C-terminal domain-containing protein [Natronoflexus pectinivorans]TCO07769.1 5'-nucleotidase-like protein [Natronoflexus pectinivorans]
MRTLLIFILFPLLIFSCNQQHSYQLENVDIIKIDDSIPQDENIVSVIKPYRDSLELIMNEVIGRNKSTIRSVKPESPLSSFVADLVLKAGKEFLIRQHADEHPVISVINVRGLRAPLPAGDVTIRNAFEVMPFENQMVAVKLNGKQIETLFNHIASIDGDGISGASFTLIEDRAEKIKIHNQKPNPNSLYWVITSDYLAAGGDHYNIFQQSEQIITSRKTIRDLIIDHIKMLNKNGEIIEPDNTVRITVKQ